MRRSNFTCLAGFPVKSSAGPIFRWPVEISNSILSRNFSFLIGSEGGTWNTASVGAGNPLSI